MIEQFLQSFIQNNPFANGYIVVGGILALLLQAQTTPRRRFFGFLINLAIQPAYMYLSFATQQWGMFLMAVPYILICSQGMWNNRAGVLQMKG